MSSLSQQLKVIGEKNASVALDRKSRSDIHSRSLIFDKKAAAAQDFDYIFQIACEGLDELLQIDLRFAKFYSTLFAESSLTFDRNVQTRDLLAQVEKNIAAFVHMLAPYFALSPALKALEWLVRRYHANIHQTEVLLLAALPYHSQNVFTRFMNVIPANIWPAIFTPIMGYRETLTPPPLLSILKCFHSDPALFRLYSKHIVDCIQKNAVYKEQLVFYLSNTVQVLASHARDLDKLNHAFIPVVLEAAIEFLKDHHFRYSATLATDVRLTIYAILSVLCSLVPLENKLIFSLTALVISGELALSPSLKKQTFVLLGQLWHFYNETELPQDADIFHDLPVQAVELEEALFHSLEDEKYHVSKFLLFYVVDKINTGKFEAAHILLFFNCASSPIFAEIASAHLMKALASPHADAVKPSAAQFFEKMVHSDRNSLSAILEKHGKTITELEMILSRTLEGETVEEIEDTVELNMEAEDDLEKSRLQFQELKTLTVSFLAAASLDEFRKITPVLLESLLGQPAKDQLQIMVSFGKSVTGSATETLCTYLLRLALTPAIHTNVRVLALKVIAETIKDLEKCLYLLVPICLVGLADSKSHVKSGFLRILTIVQKHTAELVKEKKTPKGDLFLESHIYGDASKKTIISPQDAHSMLTILSEQNQAISSVLVDSSQLNNLVFELLFKSAKPGLEKFGSLLLRTFVLNQWSLPSLPLVLKARIWSIMALQNLSTGGTDDRFVFEEDLKAFAQSATSRAEASSDNIDYEELQENIVLMIGGHTSNAKNSQREIEFLLLALSSNSGLQSAANQRIVTIFPSLTSGDLKLKICTELVDLLVKDSDIELDIDPLETLQTLQFSQQAIISLLSTVNIVTQIPEQGVAKRRRRSSSSTQKTMARDDISSMASQHLRKLSAILDVLEAQLRKQPETLASPELLQAMFKILTDLDYLCNDGKMPVMYAQETLASCMLLNIVAMKNLGPQKKHKFDSNSVRADLIVNSIRSTPSPQVQNRLLLVIAELASLAPEIILHSVMPIFTFMGAHTIRQDDEFSSTALQKTIAKVVPAITKASNSASQEIEFLLTSFVTAFQHIPRHRRVKLFVSLVNTLGCENSLHTIIFLIGQQYSSNLLKHKMYECDSLLDFVGSLLKTFSPHQCMGSIDKFFALWNALPCEAVEKDSAEYTELQTRSIFGTAIAAATTKELRSLKANLLKFLNSVLSSDEDASFATSSISLKMKIALILFDSDSSEEDKQTLLQLFNDLTSFILTNLELRVNAPEFEGHEIIDALYELLKAMLNLLPLSYFIQSILKSLQNVTDPMSIKVAKNFASLAGQRFEQEITINSLDANINSVITGELLPVLIEGVEKNNDVELVQAYLDTFATIVNKLGSIIPEFSTGDNAKFLVGALKVVTSERGLLRDEVEVIVSSLNAITSVVNCIGVKCIGLFPKILPPALKIWQATTADAEDEESGMLIQGSVLMLFSCLVKRMPAFVTTSLVSMIRAIIVSEHVNATIRSSVLDLVVEHIDKVHVLQSLCNLALEENIYDLDSASGLGLYLNAMRNAIEASEKKVATSQSSLFMKWLIKSFEFRAEYGEAKFSDNTVYSIESSFHQCGFMYVMKLNDKNFRPLFASLVRWAVSGEGATADMASQDRLLAFYKFFNKLQDSLKSIITSYYLYLLDFTAKILGEFKLGAVQNLNLRRIVLNSLSSSFKYDHDDYWSHQSRFETVVEPLMGQLVNIEEPIGKILTKTITFFVTNVSSDEHNEKLVQSIIFYMSNENDNLLKTKIWTIRVLKSVLQKMGDQWLQYLPTFIPYIAELLEDDDEEVEMEVRKDLVRVIENILGEPLDRYLH